MRNAAPRGLDRGQQIPRSRQFVRPCIRPRCYVLLELRGSAARSIRSGVEAKGGSMGLLNGDRQRAVRVLSEMYQRRLMFLPRDTEWRIAQEMLTRSYTREAAE